MYPFLLPQKLLSQRCHVYSDMGSDSILCLLWLLLIIIVGSTPLCYGYIITQNNMYQVLTNHYAYISYNSQITLFNITDLL